MLLSDIVSTSRRVRQTSSRSEKVRHLADCIRRAGPEVIETVVALLSGEPRQGRIGLGPAALRGAMPPSGAPNPELTVAEVDATLEQLARTRGAGSPADKARQMRRLLARATREERDFLVLALLGELRQGALEGLMAEAVAQAAGVPVEEIRRALMVSGNLGATARAALIEGRPGLARLAIGLFRPLKPMLAQTAEDTSQALAQLGTAAFEYKLDGARMQVHKQARDVRVFSRYLNDVTAAVPEVVEAVRKLDIGTVILDGEAIALQSDGRPRPFQVTMRRFGRKLDIERLRESIPLRPFFFDCLYVEGAAILDRPSKERAAALAGVVPQQLRVPRRVTAERAEGEAFLEAALLAGHEGVMAKALQAPYEAGARGGAWLKIKPASTLDLVILAAEWGHGRRTGWLSNLHLGARAPDTGAFVMLGKTFKGMTDEMLAWQTAELQKLAIAADGYTVQVHPRLVVEIAFNDIQASPHYPGGLALRFARVKRYRPDKRADDADTIDTVRAIYERRLKGPDVQ
jgi:DNA ligase 1